MLAHKNVVCTPHLGASTEEAQVNVARDVAIQMCDAMEGADFTGVVNVPYIAGIRSKLFMFKLYTYKIYFK